MSDISSIGNTHSGGGSGPVGPVFRNGVGQHASGEAERGDRAARRDTLELSEHARWLDSLRQLPPIRSDKVLAVREAIASGSYETPEKLDAAIELLLDDLDG